MANLFNRLGQLGVGLAIAGSVASSALYNGKSHRTHPLPLFTFRVNLAMWSGISIFFCHWEPFSNNALIYCIVDGGHRAVIFDRFQGIKELVVGEGTHFIIPWVQRPILFDIRSQPRNVPVVTGSKDLQNVNITLRILFRPKPDQLPKIYTILGVDYDERVLPSITTEVLKAVVAQFDAGELITQREVSADIYEI